MRRPSREPIYCLDAAPDDPLAAVAVRVLDRAAGPWRCTLFPPADWLLVRREQQLLRLATALARVLPAGHRQRLVAVRFRILSRDDQLRRPWLGAPCYRLFDSVPPRDLDPRHVDGLLHLDLAA